MNKQIIIDGSQGEGGGQILRTSLSLAMCLGLDINIQNIRAGRRKPGLMRQHFTCVEAAKELCDAEVLGSRVGSTEIMFKANSFKNKSHFNFNIGSAGSTSLVFQTILPALLIKKTASSVSFEGGTHNMMAPTYDFIEQAFIPALSRMGFDVKSSLEQPGFQPVGGGKWTVNIEPAKSNAFAVVKRGQLVSKKAFIRLGNLPREIGEREFSVIKQKCNWIDNDLYIDESDCLGSGNAISLQMNFDNIDMEFNRIGERNRSAEKVANAVCSELALYMKSKAVINEHLADQLLLPMVLGCGGHFTTTKPSQHLITNALVIEQLTGIKTCIREIDNKKWMIEIDQSLNLI